LSQASRIILNKFATILVKNKRDWVTVKGYASKRGSISENTRLISERADVAAQCLRQTLAIRHIKNITVVTSTGGIKRLSSPLKDQVAILTA